MADVSGAIARLVLLKAYLNATTSTNDSFYKQMLISASRAIDTECNRKFVKQEYTDEVYTAQFGQERLYLRNWPVIGAIDSIKFGTTAQTVSSFALINATDNPYIIHESGSFDLLFNTTRLRSKFPTTDSYIKISYEAGYDNTAWETQALTIDSGDVFNIPADLENAVVEYAAILWFNTPASGKSRAGISSISRGQEGISFERYDRSYPPSFRSAVERYRSVVI